MRFARQLCVPLVQGRGSFGAVYLCIDKREGRKCVGSSPTSPYRPHRPCRTCRHGPSPSSACSPQWHSRHLRMCGSGEPAQSSRPGSCGGTAAVRLFDRARLSEACRCVMKKLPFAPNLEARAACLLSIDSRACEVLSSVARCGGVLLCCNSTGSRFGGGQPPLTADWQQTDNQPTVAHHTLPHLCRAAPQCSHTAFRLQHSCTRIASAAGAAVALQRCAK
jgi:hypothetical protein